LETNIYCALAENLIVLAIIKWEQTRNKLKTKMLAVVVKENS
jgi:hypothetical protein